MKGATKAMGAMNKGMNLPALTKILRDFERQNEKMEMTGEMMGDAMDDMNEGDAEEEETDELVSQVLDEIGVNLGTDLVSAPAAAGRAGKASNPIQARPRRRDIGRLMAVFSEAGHAQGSGHIPRVKTYHCRCRPG